MTLGRYVDVSGKSGRVILNPAGGGSWIWNPPGSVEDRQLAGAGAAQTPGFLTVTSRGPVCWGLAGMLTVSVIVVPSGDTLGLVVGVMSPAGPPKLSVAPDRNRLPPSVSWTCLAAPTFVVTLPGRTAASAGVVIVKGTALLRTPLTATVTLPFTACVGTVTATDDEVAAVTVAVTLVPLVPAKVTDGVPLKPEPLIVTLLPIGPALVDRLLIVGGGGIVVVGAVPLGGAASPPVAATLTTFMAVSAPPSGLVTVTCEVVTAASAVTFTTTVIVVSFV